MVTKKVSGDVGEATNPDTTVQDNTAKVEFGTDAWGTWAQSVHDRLTAIEAQKLVVSGEELDKMRAEVKAMRAELDKVSKVKTSATTGKGSDGRLSRIEQMMGITVELDEPAVVEDSEGTFGQEVSDEAKVSTDGT